ncbi:FAD-dependent oxidoreductase, partial [Gemmatimonas sp.]|uniref:NAD(P)/FAD-dependent oxidoreductase n=1 Tax=Gemmatimonas sp. TaxID=1962908 RepID=UPI0033415A5D
MHRRTFLHAASAPLGLAALDRAGLTHVPVTTTPSPAIHTRARATVVVVGAGAFGGWTALHLREMGHDVTLVDAYGPGNSRATSGDETRQIRCGYGDRLLYARSALRAMTAWREREQQFGVALLNPTGRLQLAPDWTPSLKATQATLTTLGVKFDAMTDGDMRKRYPQMHPDGMGVGLLEPGAMVIRAKQAMLAVSQAFVRAGGTLRVARVRPGTIEGGRLVDVQVDDGSRLAADAFVFA